MTSWNQMEKIMSNDLNNCQFIGRLGKDPELRYMPNGGAVASLSIACSESWKDKSTGEKKERTEWVNLTAFGKLAEIIEKYVKKGSQIYVSGKMKTDKWKDKSDNTRYTTKVIIDKMQMLGSRDSQGGSAPASSPASSAAPAPAASSGLDDFDGDIPF